MKISELISKLEEIKVTETAFVEGGQYPRIEGALIDFLDECDVVLKESDIEQLNHKMDIDDDGYPFVSKTLKVDKYAFKVTITAYHRSDWNFYINDVECLD